jgi:para-nitrobenzyl esterase
MHSLRLSKVVTIAAIALAAVSACSPPDPEAIPTQNAVVIAGGEALQGKVLDEDSGLTVFRGIPYAAPPIGKRRWRPPAAHTPREGTQDATRFASACPQLQGNHDWYRRVAELFGNPPGTIGPLENIDEDCLYLNIWTSALVPGEKQPVIIWIHGGININGYANEPNYLGHNIAEKDVIYVSLNYRLGSLGFMAHPGLSAETSLGISGNYALLDQLKAVRWVHENIEAFGGDPDNITLAGESSGGYNIAWLMAFPLADGLFRRAIIQSGAWAVDSFVTLEQAERDGEKLATSLGFGKPLSDVEIVEAMRELDWRTVVQSAADTYSGSYGAVVDSFFLKDAAAAIFEQGTFNKVDLLIGANANESYMYLAEDVVEEDLTQMIATYGGAYKKDLAAILERNADPDIRKVMDRLGSRGSGFLCASRYIASSVAEHGNNVYFYYFTRIRPGGEKILAYHGAEIPYVFGTEDDWLPGDETDRQLSDAMMQYWVNFATAGSPNGPGLPDWPAFSSGAKNYQELGDTITSEINLEAQICAILDQQRQDLLHESQ